MLLHAFDDAFHDICCFHAEHREAFLDDFAVAFRYEFLVLELLLERLHRHAAEAFGPHEAIGLHDARELVDREEALRDRRRRLWLVDAEAPAMRDDRLDCLVIDAFWLQKLAHSY